jgi:hypothetical protein
MVAWEVVIPAMGARQAERDFMSVEQNLTGTVDSESDFNSYAATISRALD